ncbi:MAG: sugar ABC transporter permease, partial [Clostridiales bacterium]|nr:sugar ABC transporter permease [Clostridiales bacterium]
MNMYKTGQRKNTFKKVVLRDKYLILMVLPCILFFIIFHYAPMIWNMVAFQDYNIRKGIFHSEWVGFDNFVRFFQSPYAMRVIKNTFFISFLDLILGFPIPILFALLLNEVKKNRFKRVVQTFTYLPHFISTVVVVGMMKIFLSANNGIVNNTIVALGGTGIDFFSTASIFPWLYVFSNIWQNFGWDSIIYFAAISGISPELYEAAEVDGAGRWNKMFRITLPSITPTIMVLLIMRIGWLLSVGFEKIILMYNEGTYATADVISTYVYRAGLLNADFAYGTAIG